MNASTTRGESGRRRRVTLRVISGVHAGASIPLASGEMLLIGTAQDCEVILSDPDVAKHHCLVGFNSGRLTVRSVDAAISLGDGTIHGPGEILQVFAGVEVRLGSAAFSVLARGSEGFLRGGKPRVIRRTSGMGADSSASWQQRWRWVAAIGLVAVVASGLAPGVGGQNEPSMSSRNVTPGVAHEKPPTAATNERTGTAVAHDVAEILRLSGVACEAHYDGEGIVTVRGHFGDPQAVRSIVLSRAMREVEGLKRVLVVNLDQRAAPASDTEPPPGARIVAAVPGRDPYVTTADGSRYYLGATLPQRGRLSGVIAGEVLVERDGQIQHLKLPDTASGGI